MAECCSVNLYWLLCFSPGDWVWTLGGLVAPPLPLKQRRQRLTAQQTLALPATLCLYSLFVCFFISSFSHLKII